MVESPKLPIGTLVVFRTAGVGAPVLTRIFSHGLPLQFLNGYEYEVQRVHPKLHLLGTWAAAIDEISVATPLMRLLYE